MEEIEMIDSISCKELYVILNQLELFYKLPEKLRKYITENQSLSHDYQFDKNIPLFYQIDNEKTKTYLSYIYIKYINDSEAEKQLLIHEYEQNEKIKQEELKKKYNLDDIFKNKSNIDTNRNKEVLVVEKSNNSIWKKIIDKIKSFFKFK